MEASQSHPTRPGSLPIGYDKCVTTEVSLDTIKSPEWYILLWQKHLKIENLKFTFLF